MASVHRFVKIAATGVFSIAALAARVANAQALIPVGHRVESGEINRWTERPLVVDLQGGLGAPLGLIGAAFDVSALSWWSIAAGFGLNRRGPQLGVLTRVRLVGGTRRALSIDANLSFGPFRGADFMSGLIGSHAAVGEDSGYTFDVDQALFAYAGVGYDSRAERSAFRVFGGMAKLLNPAGAICTTDQTRRVLPCDQAKASYGTADAQDVLAYVGVAFGYSL